MQRSESDILSKAPIKLRLGAAEYEVQILTIGPARKWRNQLLASMADIAKTFKEAPQSENVAPAMTSALLSFPEKLAELVFAYAPNIPQDKVMSEATDEQLCFAYGKIVSVAYPFLQHLKQATQMLESL